MASGNLSVGGTCTIVSLRLIGGTCATGTEPVISLVESGEADGIAAFGGISADAVPSEAFGVAPLNDCRPIGVGDVIEGMTGAGDAGLTASSAGHCIEGVCSPELSVAGSAGTLPPSSSVIASLKVPSTMITTLALTSSERILEVTVDTSVDV